MAPIKMLQDLMADFNDFYAEEQRKAAEDALLVGEKLATWIETAEECLTNPTDVPYLTTIQTTSTTKRGFNGTVKAAVTTSMSTTKRRSG